MQKNNQGQKTEMVKKKLISLIKNSNLKIGDQLPSQAELRDKIGVGSKTIQRAIDTLEMCGILEVRPHKGVFIKRLETNGFIGHEIGLVCMWRTYFPVAASLMQCLQLQLSRNACQCKLFLRNFPEMTEVDSLSYFDGLKRCIEQGQIQGLITTVSFDDEAWSFFNKHNIPVVSLSSATYNKGYKVSSGVSLENFFIQAKKRGFKRPAIIHCGFPQTNYVNQVFSKHCNLSQSVYCRFLSPNIVEADCSIVNFALLEKILYQFAELPESQRPDVMLIPDDIITSIVHQKLLKMQLNGVIWKPFFIYQTTPQVPILSNDIIQGDYYEYDTMQHAETTVKLLLDVICGEKNEPETIYIKPKLHTV